MATIAKQKSQPHLRRAIRNRVQQLLKANVDIGERIFKSRPNPAFISEVPCIAIYFTDEPAEHMESAPRRYERKLMMNVDILHMSRDGVEDDQEFTMDDYLDSRAFEVEFALTNDRYLGFAGETDGWFQGCALVNTVPTNIVFSQEQFCGALRLVFEMQYETETYTNAGLNEFLRFYNDINTAVLGAESSDHVTIREE